MTPRPRVVLMRWWQLRPWKQARILAGNLEACRWAAQRFDAFKQPPSQHDVLDIGQLSGPELAAALLAVIGAAGSPAERFTRIDSSGRPLAWIVPP